MNVLQVFHNHRKSTEPRKLLVKFASDVYQPARYNKKRVAWHKILNNCKIWFMTHWFSRMLLNWIIKSRVGRLEPLKERERRIFFNVHIRKFELTLSILLAWSNGLVVKALKSRGPVFETTEWFQNRPSLSSFRGR